MFLMSCLSGYSQFNSPTYKKVIGDTLWLKQANDKVYKLAVKGDTLFINHDTLFVEFTPSGGGSVMAVSTTSPITGGTITHTGTIGLIPGASQSVLKFITGEWRAWPDSVGVALGGTATTTITIIPDTTYINQDTIHVIDSLVININGNDTTIYITRDSLYGGTIVINIDTTIINNNIFDAYSPWLRDSIHGFTVLRHITDNVGINTIKPELPLDVNDNAVFRNGVYALGGTGDIDNNGVINNTDYFMLSVMAHGQPNIWAIDGGWTVAQRATADVNGDGKVSMADLDILFISTLMGVYSLDSTRVLSKIANSTTLFSTPQNVAYLGSKYGQFFDLRPTYKNKIINVEANGSLRIPLLDTLFFGGYPGDTYRGLVVGLFKLRENALGTKGSLSIPQIDTLFANGKVFTPHITTAASSDSVYGRSPAGEMVLVPKSGTATSTTYTADESTLHLSGTTFSNITKDSTINGYRIGLSGKTINNTSYWGTQDSLKTSLSGLVLSTAGKLTAITNGSTNWNTAYIYRLLSATGTAPLTLTLSSNVLTGSVALFSTTSTTKGVVPGSNNVGSTYFLNGAGSWTVPPGSTNFWQRNSTTISTATAGDDLQVDKLITTTSSSASSMNVIRTLTTNFGAGITLQVGDGTTSSKNALTRYLASETTPIDWYTGFFNNYKYSILSVAGATTTLHERFSIDTTGAIFIKKPTRQDTSTYILGWNSGTGEVKATLKSTVMDSLYRYSAYSSGNNNVEVLATGLGITATKSSGTITITIPANIRIVSAKLRVETLSSLICLVVGTDMTNTSMANRWIPNASAWREDTGQQLMGSTTLMDLTNFNKFTVNGLISTTICQIKLTF